MWPFKKTTFESVETPKLTVVPEPIANPVNERLIHLRIKIKSLASEAVSIREEAKKVTGLVKWGLNHHRTSVVRVHARHNLLAYGLLRGVPYAVMERTCDALPNFKTVGTTAKNFGGAEADVTAWVEEAKRYLKECKEKK